MTEYGDQPGDGCAYGCDEHPQPDCPTHRGATTELAAQAKYQDHEQGDTCSRSEHGHR